MTSDGEESTPLKEIKTSDIAIPIESYLDKKELKIIVKI